MAFREIVAPTVKELFIQQLEGMIPVSYTHLTLPTKLEV